MAEIIYKKISDLDLASQPLGGTELAEVSQGGVSRRVSLTNIFGTGWWAALRAAFSAFVAPDADHADNADTLGAGLEEPSDFHDAAQLNGAVPLASIPAELTGKNAATATLAATAAAAASAAVLEAVSGASVIKFTTTTIPASKNYLLVSGNTITAGLSSSAGVTLSAPQFAFYVD
jgi:hypothetical protein